MSKIYSSQLELIHESGDKLYPCTMKDNETGRELFRVTPPGDGNQKNVALQVTEAEMLDYVIQRGYSVRCSTLTPTTVSKGKLIKRTGLYGLKKRTIVNYSVLK